MLEDHLSVKVNDTHSIETEKYDFLNSRQLLK